MRPDQSIPPLTRLMKKVEVTDSCWLWLGKVQANGYGQISVGSRADGTRGLAYVHRVAYEAMVGPIPDGYTIDHLCRVKLCVKPDHLEAVTQRENTLRAGGFIRTNAEKTHCLRGHEFTAENTRHAAGRRVCLTCKRTARARRREAVIHS